MLVQKGESTADKVTEWPLQAKPFEAIISEGQEQALPGGTQSGNAVGGGELISTTPAAVARSEAKTANTYSAREPGENSNVMEVTLVPEEGPGAMSEQETAFMDNVWEQRISLMTDIEELLSKRDDINKLIKNISTVSLLRRSLPSSATVSTSESLPANSTLVGRLEAEKAKLDSQVDYLVGRLVDYEMSLEATVQKFDGGVTVEQKETLRVARRSLEELGVLLDSKDPHGVEGDATPKPPHTGPEKGQSITRDGKKQLKTKWKPEAMAELEEWASSLSASLEDLEFGFDTPDFQAILARKMTKLYKEGRLGGYNRRSASVGYGGMSGENEGELREIDERSKEAQSWDGTMSSELEEMKAVVFGLREATQKGRRAVEEETERLSVAKARLIQAKEQLAQLEATIAQQSAETDASEEDHVSTLASSVLKEVEKSITQEWESLLQDDRRRLEDEIKERSAELRATLQQAHEEEMTAWPSEERQIIEEIGVALQPVLKWQNTVAKYINQHSSNSSESRGNAGNIFGGRAGVMDPPPTAVTSTLSPTLGPSRVGGQPPSRP